MFATRNCAKSIASLSLLTVALCVATFTFAGCERKERVLDVQTPAGDVEVDRNIDTGEIEVEVNDQ